MSKIAHPYQCDGCGVQRTNDANHWWLLDVYQGSLSPSDTPRHKPYPPFLKLQPWDEQKADEDDDVRHVCGQDCASQLIARWMATGSFDPPSARPVSVEQAIQPVSQDAQAGKPVPPNPSSTAPLHQNGAGHGETK